MKEHEIAGPFTPLEDKDKIPWASILPDSGVISHPEFWAAIRDLECKNKGRVIKVFYDWASTNHGLFGNNCPQDVRDKVKGMML